MAGFAVWCRPTALLFFPVPLAMLEGWRARIRFIAGSLVGIASLALVNLAWFGSPSGAYAGLNQGKFELLERASIFNLLGVLASPSRGLLWFFPALLISLFVTTRKRNEPRLRRVNLAIAGAAVLLVLLLASYSRWWGGHSVGPRLLAELALLCALSFGDALEQARSRVVRFALLSAGTLQIFLFSLLHFSPRADAWNVDVAVDANPAVLWSFRDSQVRAAFDREWTYREGGRYFEKAVLEEARRGFDWTPVDLRAFANSRYDLPIRPEVARNAAASDLYLERLASEPFPPDSHLRVLPPGASNVVRVCSGDRSATIEIGDVAARKIDTILLFRGSPSEQQRTQPAGFLTVSYANEKVSTIPLRFGSQILLRPQLNREYGKLRGRFFAGSISAPDGLQRQRFSLSRKIRVVSSLSLEVPEGSPDSCLYLLAASLGKSIDDP